MLKILDQEKDFLVVAKPAGLIVHPPHKNYQKISLSQQILEKYPEIAGIGDDINLRPGIVHRLDVPVSGLLLIARTQKGFIWLKQQFKERQIDKRYLGLVYGSIKSNQGEIILPLQKGLNKTKVKPLGTACDKEKIKKAVTQFVVLDRFQHYTFLEIKTLTGRTHQIRAHLCNYGHSLVGDKKYCNKRYKRRKAFTKFVKSDRVFLHLNRIKFKDLGGSLRQYSLDLPELLQEFLKTLH